MAKRKIKPIILWSKEAKFEWKNIVTYWLNRNKSNAYPKKLNKLLKELLSLIQRNPQIGRDTEIKDVKAILLYSYIIFYRTSEKEIEIVSIWDGRRNPDEMPVKTK